MLAFYPGDWTPVCATQVPDYQAIIGEFEKYECQLLGISVDSVACHKAWAQALGGLSFPLMSDYFPHGETARSYGILSEKGYAERTVFLVDKNGVIRFIEKVKSYELPDNDKLFAELAKLRG